VAAVAAVTGAIWPAMAVLVIPGAVALLVLLRVRRSMGDPIESRDETATTEATDAADRPRSRPSRLHGRLPSVFWLFAASSAATTAGLVTFAVISYHLTQDHVVPVAAVPLIYAAAMAAEALAAMAAEALAALVSGWLFDRTRGRVLAALPLLITGTRPGVRRLPSDRHHWCAALGRGRWSS
jgi:hypothetical protein